MLTGKKRISDEQKKLDAMAADKIKRELKAEMLLNNVSYALLTERLNAMGYPMTEQGLKNTISKCTFKATLREHLYMAIRGEFYQ